MRILHVISTVDPKKGGPSEGIRQRGKYLKSMGHDVEVLSADEPNAAFLRQSPIRVHAVGPGKGALARTPKLMEWLLKHGKEYDAIIANGIWQSPSLVVRKAAKKLGRPYWVFPHGMLDPYFNRESRLKALKKQIFWIWQYPVLRDATAVLFTCEEERRLAREAFKPYSVTEYVVKYGTAGPEGDPEAHKAAFAAAFPQLADKPFLLFLSRIHPKKGVDMLLKAFREQANKRPDLHIVLAGPVEDAYRKEMDALVPEPALRSRIHWVGMLSGDVKWGAFRHAEAFVLPSHQENFGIAIVEALACGLPALITNRVNIWREIEADGAGFVEDDTDAGIANLLRRWIAIPSAGRQAMSEKALYSYNERFTVRHSAETLLAAIKETK